MLFMAAVRRIQLLIDSDELKQLCALARRRRTSVAELIRCAVRESYLKAQVRAVQYTSARL
jgi:hypothetical protein